MFHQRTPQRDIEQRNLAGTGSGFDDTLFHTFYSTETSSTCHIMGLPSTEY
jgi:hypothetical protein